MAKKGNPHTLASQRKHLRKATAYGAARNGVGAVLIVTGTLCLLGAVIFAFSDWDSPGPVVIALLLYGIASYAVHGVVGAVFDLADAALDTRLRAQLENVRRENPASGLGR